MIAFYEYDPRAREADPKAVAYLGAYFGVAYIAAYPFDLGGKEIY